MAELPDVQAAVVLAWFADAYNRARGSAYALRHIEPEHDPSCDYEFRDASAPSDSLKVQLTRASIELSPTQGSPSQFGIPLHRWFKSPADRRPPGVIRGDHDDFLVAALRHKQARLGPSAEDLILLVLFDLVPYEDGLDVQEMRAVIEAEPEVTFREVWVACETRWPAGRADRVWPPA
jgi:hypothetical protein